MQYQRLWYVLPVVAGLSLSHCKTAAPASSAKVDVGAPPASTEAVFRLVWANGIEQVLPPAKDLPPIAKNMEGLFYCRSELCGKGQVGLTNGTALMTIEKANYATDGSISFDIFSPSMYAYNPSAKKYADVKDMQKSASNDIMSYKMVFEDANHGELIATVTIPNSRTPLHVTKHAGGPDDKSTWFTFDLVEPGHWKRKTMQDGKLQPEYDLLQIVGPDGQRTDNYKIYLADLAAVPGPAMGNDKKKMVVAVPLDSDLGRGGPIPPEGGTIDASGASSISSSSRDSRDASDPTRPADDRKDDSGAPKDDKPKR